MNSEKPENNPVGFWDFLQWYIDVTDFFTCHQVIIILMYWNCWVLYLLFIEFILTLREYCPSYLIIPPHLPRIQVNLARNHSNRRISSCHHVEFKLSTTVYWIPRVLYCFTSQTWDKYAHAKQRYCNLMVLTSIINRVIELSRISPGQNKLHIDSFRT